MTAVTSIYVLPSEQGSPPRAILGEYEEEDDVPGLGEPVQGMLATWSQDLGVWMIGPNPLPNELSDAITDHAKNLGVEW